MTISSQVRLALKDDDPDLAVLRRLTRRGERAATGLRRAIARYSMLIENTGSTPPIIIRDLSEALLTTRLDLFTHNAYPSREVFTQALESASVPGDKRKRLIEYVSRLTFPEYAKMIEALEMMY